MRRAKKPKKYVKAADASPESTVPHGGGETLVEVGAILGTLAGAAAGAIAGPPGIVAGGAIGTAIGALAGAAEAQEEERRSARDSQLDDIIGVTKGDLGAAKPGQPPPKRGAYSPASLGISSGGSSSSEGPIQSIDED